MCLTLLQDSRLYGLLLAIDREFAEEVRAGGCPCGGALHRADYPRKPRGGPPGFGREHERRLSFCCGCEGCRRRRTPRSVRYLGRRIYFGAVVVLVSAMQGGLSERRVRRLRELLGVSRRTLWRWRHWWLECFAGSEFWRRQRSRFVPPVVDDALPASLLERFTGADDGTRLIQALSFLSPLTTSSC